MIRFLKPWLEYLKFCKCFVHIHNYVQKLKNWKVMRERVSVFVCTYILWHGLKEVKFRWMTMLFHWIGLLLKQKGSYPCIGKLKVTQWGNHGLPWLLEASGSRWVQDKFWWGFVPCFRRSWYRCCDKKE